MRSWPLLPRRAPLVVLVLLATFLPGAGRATEIVVDTRLDDSAEGPNGDCSLREAVIAANTDAPVDGCPAGSGTDTVILGASHYDVIIAGPPGEAGSLSGSIDITGALTIRGAGADATKVEILDGTFDYRGVRVLPGAGPVTLSDLSIEDWDHAVADVVFNQGTLTIARATILGGLTASVESSGFLRMADSTLRWRADHHLISSGTAVLERVLVDGSDCNADSALCAGILNRGTMALIDSTVRDHPALPVLNAGSGIRNEDDGNLRIERSAIVDNVGNRGGGVWNGGGSVEILDSQLLGNRAISAPPLYPSYAPAPGVGGGIFSVNGTVTVTDSEISSNGAEAGGGAIAATNSSVTVVRTRASDNDGGTGTAAIYQGPVFVGGFEDIDRLSIQRSTIDGNHASGPGGAVYLWGRGEIENSTLSGNRASSGTAIYLDGSASTLTVGSSTLVADASDPTKSAVFATPGSKLTFANDIVSGSCKTRKGGKPFATKGGNVEGPANSCGLDLATDRRGRKSLGLAPLDSHGTPLPTHALVPSSPAIDWALSAACPATDEAGTRRPIDGNRDGAARCDSGAYEYQPR